MKRKFRFTEDSKIYKYNTISFTVFKELFAETHKPVLPVSVSELRQKGRENQIVKWHIYERVYLYIVF